MSNDVDRIYDAIIMTHYLWAATIFMVAVFGLMIKVLGYSALIGFGTLMVLFILQLIFAQMFGYYKSNNSVRL